MSTLRPSTLPTKRPSTLSTLRPSTMPTLRPSTRPTKRPSSAPTRTPTKRPTKLPSARPATLTPTNAAGKKTNFVILLADDLGWGDVSFNGGFKSTPNLMAMANAENTIRFSNFHSGSAVCSPTRAAMLSGQYPDRNCVSGPTTGLVFQARNSTPTFALDAKQAGYSTIFLGKWHLSGIDKDFIGNRGFDSWTASYGNIMTFDSPCMCQDVQCKENCQASPACATRRVGGTPYCYNPRNTCEMGAIDLDTFQTTGYPAEFECGMKTKRDGAGIEDANMPPKTTSCDFLVDKFQDYLEALPAQTPFLAVLSFHETHKPFVADPVLRTQCERGSVSCTNPTQQMGANSAQANYYSVIESLDAAIGRVRALLKTHGHADDTFVIFTSDNGPEKHEQGGAGSAGPFQGMKRSLYEGGTRVPALIEYPKLIPRNMHIPTSLVSILDLRPTIRDILQLENPRLRLADEPVLDGESLLPLFRAPADWYRGKDLLICLQVTYNQVVAGKRVRLCESYAFYRTKWKMIVTRDAESKNGALYNLDADPGEASNVLGKQQKLFAEMVTDARELIDDVFADYASVCGNGFAASSALDEENIGLEYEDV